MIQGRFLERNPISRAAPTSKDHYAIHASVLEKINSWKRLCDIGQKSLSNHPSKLDTQFGCPFIFQNGETPMVYLFQKKGNAS